MSGSSNKNNESSSSSKDSKPPPPSNKKEKKQNNQKGKKLSEQQQQKTATRAWTVKINTSISGVKFSWLQLHHIDHIASEMHLIIRATCRRRFSPLFIWWISWTKLWKKFRAYSVCMSSPRSNIICSRLSIAIYWPGHMKVGHVPLPSLSLFHMYLTQGRAESMNDLSMLHWQGHAQRGGNALHYREGRKHEYQVARTLHVLRFSAAKSAPAHCWT